MAMAASSLNFEYRQCFLSHFMISDIGVIVECFHGHYDHQQLSIICHYVHCSHNLNDCSEQKVGRTATSRYGSFHKKGRSQHRPQKYHNLSATLNPKPIILATPPLPPTIKPVLARISLRFDVFNSGAAAPLTRPISKNLASLPGLGFRV